LEKQKGQRVKLKLDIDLVMVSGNRSATLEREAYTNACLSSLKRCRDYCDFSSVWWFTDLVSDCAGGVNVYPNCVRSIEEYSHYMIHELPLKRHLFLGSHILVIQHDGFIVNPAAWTDDFLFCDYIGAPFGSGVVGCGGFSLRSQRLLDCMHKLSYETWTTPRWRRHEDYVICVEQRKRLEDMGCQFATAGLAQMFSTHGTKPNGSFGAHRPLE
jgi:hypothetical protein